MPVTYKLSGIFDKRKLNAALKEAMGKTLDEFAEYIPEQQRKSVPTGKLYKKGSFSGRNKIGGVKASGRGTKVHRASARGQRPAIDTGKLNRSTKKKRLGAFKGEVTTVAKNKGFDYAEHLQEKMDRPIQDERDAKVGEKMLQANMEKALAKLK